MQPMRQQGQTTTGVHPTAQRAMTQGTGGFHNPVAKRDVAPGMTPTTRPTTGARPVQTGAPVMRPAPMANPQLVQLLLAAAAARPGLAALMHRPLQRPGV